MRTIVIGLLAMLVSACATTDRHLSAEPTPADVAARDEARGLVHWGGEIVKVKNLSDRTLVEVLAYPLDGEGRPHPGEQPIGRFIVDKPGFIEPHEYAPGRLLEVRGQLHGFSAGRVGDAPYRYPVVIGATLALWPDQPASLFGRRQPRINFGIGVSNHGGGVGVGIGF